MSRLRRCLLACGFLLMAPGAAQAGVFTIDAVIALNQNGVSGEIRPVTDITGLFLLTDGTIDFGDQDVILFEVELFGGSADIDQIGLGAQPDPIFPNPSGAGAFDDGGGLQGPDGVTADGGVTLTAIFDFDFGGVSAANLEAGETTVRLFATYDASGGGPGALSSGSLVSFMISTGTNFDVQGTLVPEPSSVALLAGGLAGLSLVARRRRKA